MKVRTKVSTNRGAKPGDVIEVSETEGRTLIAGKFATLASEKKRPPKKKGSEPEASAEGETTTEKKEG